MLDFLVKHEFWLVIGIIICGVLTVVLPLVLNVVKEHKASLQVKAIKMQNDELIAGKNTLIIKNAEVTKKIDELQVAVSKIVEKLGSDAKSRSQQIETNKVNMVEFGRYGGAIIVNLSFAGASQDRRCIFDYGTANSPDKNRVTLYIDPDEVLILKLYDEKGETYQLSSKLKIIPNESREIMCLWNNEYGVMALFADGVLKAKIALSKLDIKSIIGELWFGSSFQNERGMDMLLQQVRVYSFKN